ncbi:unnamed protein product [Blepharisma stoltei]|uniref:Sm domain-containing protein n=1 Tax=Blepharisma stoltei TaxID=1481888 RepID=A0AAU9JW13_9CILI|nr:unnamed protein product [Blepharisma stoltei]
MTEGNSSNFFKNIIGNQVLIKLNCGEEMKGVLEALDGKMNVALRDDIGLVIIRGNNILYITRTEAPAQKSK